MVASYVCFGLLTAISIFAMNFPETEKGVLIASLIVLIITIAANANVLLDDNGLPTLGNSIEE